MGITVQEAIDTVYMDTAHYDVVLSFPSGYEDLNNLAVYSAKNLVPFTVVNGKLETQEFTIEAYVTAKHDRLLQALYLSTVHTRYIDQRYPVMVYWGNTSDVQYTNQVECYLANYTPPESVDFKNSEILNATLVLRAI